MTTIALDGGLAGPSPVVRHRADTYDLIVSGMLVIYLVFFFVGERIESLPIPIRVEDFVYLMLIPLGYRYLARAKTTLFYWIAAYFLVSAIPYFAAAAAGQYGLSVYPIIMIKEIQYFYVAYLICQNRSPIVFGTIDALAALIIFDGLREIVSGRISYYGIGAIGNRTSPSLSGALYLFSAVWLLIRLRLLSDRWLRLIVYAIAGLGMVCVVATISRSSILALIVYLATYALLTSVVVFPTMLAALGMSPWVLQWIAVASGSMYGYLALKVLSRIGQIGESAVTRTDKWQNYMSLFDPMDFVFGRGKGYPNALDGTFSLGVDSQYLRTLMENGVVGIVLVAGMLLTILHQIKKRGGEYQHAWAVVMAMLIMCIPMEALQLSKSGGFFWLILFYLLMCQRRSDRVTLAPVAAPTPAPSS